MVEKKYKLMILASFVATTLIFVAGIMLGVGIDKMQGYDALSTLQNIDLNTESYIIEKEFLNQYAIELPVEDRCTNLIGRFWSLSTEINDLRHVLILFEDKKLMSGKSYDLLVRDYFLTEIQLYMYLENFREDCDKNLKSIVFFYDIDPESKAQGAILDSVLEERNDIFIITLKSGFNDKVDSPSAKDPLFDLFEGHFEVTDTPTLIINGQKYTGIVNIDDLNQYLNS